MDEQYTFPDNTSVLVSSLERLSAEQTPIDLDILFSGRERNSFNFEILFVTLVSTALLSVPNTQTILDPIAIIAAVGLIALTTLRKIGLDNTEVNTEDILSKTLRSVWVLSYFGFGYIFLSISDSLVPNPPELSYAVFAIIMATFCILLFISYEVVFKDLSFWCAVVVYNNYAQKDEPRQGVLSLELANLALQYSFHKYNEEHYAIAKIRHHWNSEDYSSPSPRLKFVMVILFIVIILLGVLIIGLPFSFISDVGLFVSAVIHGFLGITAVFSSALISFFYVRYGTASYNNTPDVSYAFFTMTVLILTHAGVGAVIANTITQFVS